MSHCFCLSSIFHLCPNKMTKEFVLVRHSERIDEVDMPLWATMVDRDTSGRDFMSVSNDPPITANGIQIAKRAAVSVSNLSLIANAQREGKVVKIYSSRLIRCVQTAYEIAVMLRLPIYISSGLSQTAIAVIKARGTFEFQSMESLRAACPSVELIDCDDASNRDLYVPNTNWQGAIETIVKREEVSILVVHRETIRNFCNYRPKTPYCCLGLVAFTDLHVGNHDAATNFRSHSEPLFHLKSIRDHLGHVLESPTKDQNIIRNLVGNT